MSKKDCVVKVDFATEQGGKLLLATDGLDEKSLGYFKIIKAAFPELMYVGEENEVYIDLMALLQHILLKLTMVTSR